MRKLYIDTKKLQTLLFLHIYLFPFIWVGAYKTLIYFDDMNVISKFNEMNKVIIVNPDTIFLIVVFALPILVLTGIYEMTKCLYAIRKRGKFVIWRLDSSSLKEISFHIISYFDVTIFIILFSFFCAPTMLICSFISVDIANEGVFCDSTPLVIVISFIANLFSVILAAGVSILIVNLKKEINTRTKRHRKYLRFKNS